MKQKIKSKIYGAFKTINLTALIAAVLLGQIVSGVVFEETAYAEEYWAERYVNNLVQRNIMRGDQDGELNPKDNVTRAEYVSMLNRALGYTETDKNPFRDVKGTEWYASDIEAAYKQGYFSGSGRSMANPNGELTREEAVTMLCKALKVEGLSGENLNFKDSRSFSSWSKDYINSSADKKYVNGYEDNTFRSTNKITRGEVAKIITDSVGEIIGGPGMGSLGYIEGNATISSSGVSLENTVIQGDLYITEGVGLGYTSLKNVKVMGEVIISGAGESNVGRSSITLTDCIINTVTIDGDPKKTLTLKTDGSTVIKNTIVKTDTYLEEMTDRDGGFDTVILNGPKKTRLNLAGSFSEVVILGEENELALEKGSIATLNVEEECIKAYVHLEEDTIVRRANIDTEVEITGKGEIDNIVINANDVVVEGLPDNIEIRPGIIAKINGKDMTSAEAEISSASPKIMSGYPDIIDLEATTAIALIKTNKPGTLYWAVTLKSEDLPSTDQIIKGPKDAVKTGKLTVNANEEKEIKLSGFKSNTKYVISAVMIDNKDDRTSKKTKTFTTVDNIIPTFVSGYPKIIEIGNTSINVAVNPTKDCKYYWAVYPAGSIAPTAKALAAQKLTGEVSKGSSSGGKINVETIFTVGGLAEAKAYDLYIVASDTEAENISVIKKMSFTTIDKTAPKFITGYPKTDKITDTAVEVIFNVDKDSTVYYVVCKRGQEFPVIIPKPTTQPSFDMQIFKDAVITGNNSFKKGQGTAKANVEGKLSVSGLAKETPYDLYLVAQDKFKNASDVIKMEIKTADVYPPTAVLSFDEMIDKSPTVEGDVLITFSEIVCTSFKDETVGGTLVGTQLKDVPKAELKNNITLYQIVQTKRTVVEMNYDKIKVDEVDGKTIVTLNKEASNLKSGVTYEFELNKIMDTSGNKMLEKTLLPRFTTVAPLVEMVATVSPREFDLTFEMTPQAVTTPENVLYDITLKSDASVGFELYEKKDTDGIISGDDDKDKFERLGDGAFFMAKDTALTIRYLLDMQNKTEADNPEYKFESFNTFKNVREYAIRFTEVDGNKIRASWGKPVNVSVQCVIGSKTALSAIAADVNGMLAPSISNGSATLVHYPKDFAVFAPFTDMIIPSMLKDYPKFESGETKIRVLTRTDKSAELYYLIAPANKVGQEVVVTTTGAIEIIAQNEEDIKKLPSAQDIMNKALTPEGGFNGNFTINGANVENGFTVPTDNGKLKANEAYDFYYVLKGTPPEASSVKRWRVTTTNVQPPKFNENKTNVLKKGETFVNVTTEIDSDATIYWVVYAQNVYEKPSAGRPGTKPSATDIKNIVENSETVKPIASGMVKAKANTPISIECKNLKTNLYYDFFATAQKDLGGEPAEVEALWGIKPQDMKPPTITGVNTALDPNVKPEETGVYKGSFGITFSEPLYFVAQDGAPLQALTADKFKEKYISIPGKDRPQSGIAIDTTAGEIDEGSNPEVTAINNIIFTFNNVTNGSYISFNYAIHDKAGNKAGNLMIKFSDRERAWSANFTTEAAIKTMLSAPPMQRSIPNVAKTPEVQAPEPKTPEVQAPRMQAPQMPVAKAPIFTALPELVGKGESFIDVTAKVDMDSTVYWAVYSATSSIPSIIEIKSGNKSISSGSTNAEKDVKFTMSCNGLESGTGYKLYAYAESRENKAVSAIASLNNMITEEAVPRGVSVKTHITKTEDTKVMSYSGSVTIDIPMALYYKSNKGVVYPLKPEIYKQMISRSGVKSLTVSRTNVRGDGTLSSVSIDFNSATDAARIGFGYAVCDKNGKSIGKLEFNFNENNLEWETNFGK